MDVVELILARSDVEDVLRCKSVCKSWYNLISSDYFVKTHLNRSYNNNREHGYLRIRLHWKFNNVADNKFRDCMIVGSCNGLVCIFTNFKDELLVTNPSTREVRILPKPCIKYRGRVICGFGYDSATDDYKVVVGFNQSKHHMRFQVLSLKSNKWKLVGDNDNLTYLSSFNDYNCGFLYDGALHWFMDDTTKNKKKTIILSFDICLEKFKEIVLPNDHTEYVYDERDRLGMFEERLCIYRCSEFYDFNAIHRQTWVMKNDNCWELVPHDYEGNKNGAATTAYVLDFIPDNTWCLFYDYQGNIHLSWRNWYNITCPVFVKSLVSPYPFGKPTYKKNNKRSRRLKADSSSHKQ
ncbi:F-box protein CPR1-like [Rutidosis leptorrhynchoides]|uniref:F-box protein CPR1-like n=1 Tax=Rutidosis leptorrhynchoides TaxID=125765 RepID=UPI003A99140E